MKGDRRESAGIDVLGQFNRNHSMSNGTLSWLASAWPFREIRDAYGRSLGGQGAFLGAGVAAGMEKQSKSNAASTSTRA